MNTSKNPKISLFMLVRNNLEYTQQCLYSIRKCTKYDNYEIIIVNNASDDGTQEWLESYDPRVPAQAVKNDENKSFAVGNNQAASLATGEYYVLINNDVIVTHGWLEKMLSVFSREEKVGVVGCRILRPGIGSLQHCGVIESDMRLPSHEYFNFPYNIPEATVPAESFAVTGACMMTLASLYDEFPLDERYVYGWEDIDYCNRVKEKGYHIWYEPSSVVYHYESKTPGRYTHDAANLATYMRQWVQYSEK